MKKAALFLLVVSGLFSLYFFVASEPVAMITSIEGDVYLLKENSTEKIKLQLGDEIFFNDLIITGKKSKAVIYFYDGAVYILEEGCELTIGKSLDESSLNDGTNVSFVKSSDISTMTNQKMGITSKQQRDLALLTPAKYRGYGVIPVGPSGFISSLSPTFCWVDSTDKSSSPKDANYVLIVIDEDFEEVLRKEIPGKTIIPNYITVSEFVLTPGSSSKKYYWDIYAKGKEPKQGSQYELEGSFTLRDKRTIQTVNDMLSNYKSDWDTGKIDANTYYLLCGLYLKENKFYYDAISYFENLLKLNDKYKYPYEEIAYLYSLLGSNSSIMMSYFINLSARISLK